MKIDDAVTMAAHVAKQSAKATLRRAKGRTDLGTQITCIRGDEPVVSIVMRPDRDEMLQVSDYAASGFGADLLALSFDTFMVSGHKEENANDPRTGKHWAQGAMQTYVDEFGFDGTVVEGILTMGINRAGDIRFLQQTYEVAGRSVHWADAEAAVDGDRMTGIVPNALRQIMLRKTLDQAFATTMPQVFAKFSAADPQRARWHMDIAACEFIQSRAPSPLVMAVFAEKGSPRDQVFRRRFPRSQIIDLRDLGDS